MIPPLKGISNPPLHASLVHSLEEEVKKTLAGIKNDYNPVAESPSKEIIGKIEPKLESAFSSLQKIYQENKQLSREQKALLSEIFCYSGRITYQAMGMKKESAVVFGYSALLDSAEALGLPVDLAPIFRERSIEEFKKNQGALVDGEDDPLKPFLNALKEDRALLIDKMRDKPEAAFQLGFKVQWLGYSYQNFDPYFSEKLRKKEFLPQFKGFYETCDGLYEVVKGRSDLPQLQGDAKWWWTKIRYDTEFYCLSLETENVLVPEEMIEAWKKKMEGLSLAEETSPRSCTMRAQIPNLCAVRYQKLRLNESDPQKAAHYKALEERCQKESLELYDRYKDQVFPSEAALAVRNFVQSKLSEIAEKPGLAYDREELIRLKRLIKAFLREGTPSYLPVFYMTFAVFAKLIEQKESKAAKWMEIAAAEIEKDPSLELSNYLNACRKKYFPPA